MRTLLLVGLSASLLPLAGCDSTGIDRDDPGTCYYSCGDDDPYRPGPGDTPSHPGPDGGDTGGDGGTDGGTDGDKRFVEVSPRATYLRTSFDAGDDARAVRLSDVGLAPGKAVCFRSEGDFRYGPDVIASERRQSLGTPMVTAVFSRSDVLRGRDQQHRVADAAEAGPDVFTEPTYHDGFATDVGQDFDATDVCLTVPDGATHVFFSAFDTYYDDNSDLRVDGRPFGVSIQK